MDKKLIFTLIKTLENNTKELKEAVDNDNISTMRNMLYSITVTTKEINDLIRDFL
jgi:wobble nucleotide-excising tRNase